MINRFKDMVKERYIEMTYSEFAKALRVGLDDEGQYFNMVDFFWYCRDALIEKIDDERDRKAYFHFARWHYEEMLELEEELNDIKEILAENTDILGVHVPFGHSPLQKFEFVWSKEL